MLDVPVDAATLQPDRQWGATHRRRPGGKISRVAGDDDSEAPPGSPVAVTRRFVAEVREEYGRLGDLLLEAFTEYLGCLPDQGRVFAGRLISEERETAATTTWSCSPRDRLHLQQCLADGHLVGGQAGQEAGYDAVHPDAVVDDVVPLDVRLPLPGE